MNYELIVSTSSKKVLLANRCVISAAKQIDIIISACPVLDVLNSDGLVSTVVSFLSVAGHKIQLSQTSSFISSI